MPAPAPPTVDLETAKVKSRAWDVFWIFAFGVFIYLPTVADGMKILFPTFAKGRILGIDRSMIAAAFMLFIVSYSWKYALLAWFKIDAAFAGHSTTFRTFIVWLAPIVLFIDAALIYASLSRMSWSKGVTFSWPALLGTGAIVSVILIASMISVNLKKPLLEN